jgi:hypothetical protein
LSIAGTRAIDIVAPVKRARLFWLETSKNFQLRASFKFNFPAARL